MDKLKITIDYLNELKLSLQDEYDNSPEDRYEKLTDRRVKKVKEQGE